MPAGLVVGCVDGAACAHVNAAVAKVIHNTFPKIPGIRLSSFLKFVTTTTLMTSPYTLEIRGNEFYLKNQPFRLIGGAIHFPRVPKALWKDRLEKLIAIGCNTVETYVFWNAHEPYPNEFHFEDHLDIVAFVELAGSMGLNVIIRPGPYVCAEWDMGGLPWWLNAEDDIELRCDHPKYLAHVERYWKELIPKLVPYLSTKGGPIIAMQFENEYGYSGNDKGYLTKLRDLLRKLGVDVLLFTSDGTYQRLTINNGGLDGHLRTANFGSGAVERFKVLREFQPTGPLVCMEFWVGWFDTWAGEKHSQRAADDAAKELNQLLEAGGHFVFYMFHGGTNFGFTAGANLNNKFSPYVTSYDYDALLDEPGDTTPKYEACREVLKKYTTTGSTRVFDKAPRKAFGNVELTEFTGLFDALPKPTHHVAPQPIEKLGHGNGYVLYRHQLAGINRGEKLRIRGMHDWCNIFLNGQSLATWYRNDEHPEVKLDFDGDSATLDILVHPLARSNFGHMMKERKGITQGVYVGPQLHEERVLWHWDHYVLTEKHVAGIKATSPATNGPGIYRGTFNVDAHATTFLALPGWNFGFVILNGFNLGRYWKVGPQKTLYVPPSLLKAGKNDITIFEAVGCENPHINLQAKHEIGQVG